MNVTGNTTAFIESEQYSAFILRNIHDGLLPTSFYRDVSDFGSGETLHIKTIGSATLQDVEEDVPLPVTNTALDTPLLCAIQELIIQLKLINIRLEEGFDTKTNDRDVK